MSDQTAVPKGYWQAADGSLTPEALVKPVDKDRHLVVTDLCEQAMQAIQDSMQVASTKPYIRFYERNEAGEYVAIPLDVAGV